MILADIFASIWAFVADNQITLIAATINFVWVYLEYKASMWLWPVGIILPIFYIIVSLQAHFYGNVLINVYYLATSIWGWWVWSRRQGETEQGRICVLPFRAGLLSFGVALPLYWLLYWLLSTYTDSVLPWADALATMISFIGMIWLARRWREHWICWIVANALSVMLFYLSADYVSLVVFACNFVIAIFGYIKWIELSKEPHHATLF
ncbi:MAG: nicotinamide riboside transporter PnuC [Porphyromonadaceae bacterium]|nr:nicotinamide riboside transporter PnuC [Porphyromonadaceae bacterium]